MGLWSVLPDATDCRADGCVGSGAEVAEQLVYELLGHDLHLGVGAVLNRVGDEHSGGFESESFGLGCGGVDEHLGGDEHRRDAADFKVNGVVHTARRAAASIGERFDHQVALLGDLMAQVRRRGLGEGGFGVALHPEASVFEQLLEPIEKHVAAGLADVEQTDGHAVDDRWSLAALTGHRPLLVGGIKDDGQRFAPSLCALVWIGWQIIWLPVGPDTQPSMRAENNPASPPAYTIAGPSQRGAGVDLAS